MAASEDPQMREAARFEGALDVLGTVSWNFVKKDWDQARVWWRLVAMFSAGGGEVDGV